jgi:hypothetical protein
MDTHRKQTHFLDNEILIIDETSITSVKRTAIHRSTKTYAQDQHQRYPLCNEQKHDSIKSVARSILENETRSNPDRINARQTLVNLYTKHAQTDKEKNGKCKKEQYSIEGLQCHPDVTHTPSEEVPFFIDFEKGEFDFCTGDVVVTIFVEYPEGGFCGGMGGIRRVEVGWNEVGPSVIFEAIVDQFCKSLHPKDLSLVMDPNGDKIVQIPWPRVRYSHSKPEL